MAPYLLYLLGAQAFLLLTAGQRASKKVCPTEKQMEVIYEWNLIDFTWPSEKAREEAIQRNEYYPKNATLYDVSVYENRYFLSLPRFKYGCPATLSTISDKKKNGQYLLKPFPDWESNRLGNCNGLTSVYTTKIDPFGRLWVLDAGAVDISRHGAPKVPDRICQPQIVIYDLTANDKLVGRFRIPNNVLDCNTLLLKIELDVRDDQRDDVFAYMTDVYAPHLIVFDFRRKMFQRITHNTFLPDPHYGDFYIGGTRIIIPDGLISLALGPVCDNDRRVYYHTLDSVEECWVMASTIRDKAYATNERAYPDSYFCYSKKRDSQSTIEVITEDGIIFFNQERFSSVACWNTEIDYNMENTPVVAHNDTTMQAIEALKLVGSDLYGVSIRLQLFLPIPSLLSAKEVNFRVLRASVDDLICGTPCEKPCPGDKQTWRS